jgi:hypothetical protein
LADLATSHKSEAETLLIRQPELSTSIPAMYEVERRRYEEIKSAVSRPVPTAVAELILRPTLRSRLAYFNGGDISLPKPSYPPDAHQAGASGTVEVRVVLDETGKRNLGQRHKWPSPFVKDIRGRRLASEVCSHEAVRKTSHGFRSAAVQLRAVELLSFEIFYHPDVAALRTKLVKQNPLSIWRPDRIINPRLHWST